MRTAYDARRDALALGHPTYIGRACAKCKGKVRRTVDAGCNSCEDDSYYTKNREARRTYAKDYYHRTKHLRRREQMLKDAKNRAGVKNLVFELSVEDIVIPEICPVLGIPMTSPSLDRFDNDIGYTKANIRVISLRANQLKKDGTLEEFEKIVRYMRGK